MLEPWEAGNGEYGEPWELQGEEEWEEPEEVEEEEEQEVEGGRAAAGSAGFSNLQNLAEQHPDLLQALLGMHRDPSGRISGGTLRQVEAALREGEQPPRDRGGPQRKPAPAKSPRKEPRASRRAADAEAEEVQAAKAIQARVRGNLARKSTRALRAKAKAKVQAPRSPKRAGGKSPIKMQSAAPPAASASPPKAKKKKKPVPVPAPARAPQNAEGLVGDLAEELYTEFMDRAAAKIQAAWKKRGAQRGGRSGTSARGGAVKREVSNWERRKAKQQSEKASSLKKARPASARPRSSVAREELLADVPGTSGLQAPSLGPKRKPSHEALEKDCKPAQIFLHLERSSKDGMSVTSHVLKFHARANQGGIPNRELCEIVPEILPTGSPAQLGYLQAMLQAHGGDVTSMTELRSILKDCRQAAAAGERLLQRPTAATATLEDFTELLDADIENARRFFSEIDEDSDGKLTLPQVTDLFSKIREYSSSTEIQILATYLFRMFGMQAHTYTFGALRKAMTLFRTASKLSPGKRNPGTLHRIGPIPSENLEAELGAGAPQLDYAGPGLFAAGPGAAAPQVAAEMPLSPRAEGPPPLHPAYRVRTEGKSLLLQNWTDKVQADRESKKHAAIRREERRKFESMNLKDLYRSLPNNSNLKRSIAALRLSHAAQMLRVIRERRAAQAQCLQERGQSQRTELAWTAGVGPSRDLGGIAGHFPAEALQQPVASSSPERYVASLPPAAPGQHRALAHNLARGDAAAGVGRPDVPWATTPLDIRNTAGAVVSELEATLNNYMHFVESHSASGEASGGEPAAPAVLQLPDGAEETSAPEQGVPKAGDALSGGPGSAGILERPPRPVHPELPLTSAPAQILPGQSPQEHLPGGLEAPGPLQGVGPLGVVPLPAYAGWDPRQQADFAAAAVTMAPPPNYAWELPFSQAPVELVQPQAAAAFAPDPRMAQSGPLQVYPRLYYGAAPSSAPGAAPPPMASGAGPFQPPPLAAAVPRGAASPQVMAAVGAVGGGVGSLAPLSALAAAQRSALARAELEMAYTETWKQAQAVYEE